VAKDISEVNQDGGTPPDEAESSWPSMYNMLVPYSKLYICILLAPHLAHAFTSRDH
jgi:hypothetical protein